MNKRITMVIGAGAPLGFTLPQGITLPSTSKITETVCKPYYHYEGRNITIVEEIYQHLVNNYPLTPQADMDWKNSNPPIPNINFEMLFHVMESYLTNEKIWSNNCHNADISPVFSLFTKPAVKYNAQDLDYIMMPFILRIMDIVNDYDQYYRQNMVSESWYRDFFRYNNKKLDVFNFNYDTTIEETLESFEDGFEPFEGHEGVEAFNPQKLWNNKYNLSTINHLHGCLRYYYPSNYIKDHRIYEMHDLFKYKDYATVKSMIEGRSQSNPTTQDHSEYFGGPIITGLRKSDKLLCVPYDYYHGHLYNCLMRNNALVIIGYSFGDVYMNNLINRMALMHGEKKKIVLIDYWNESEVEEKGFGHYLSYSVPAEMSAFLMKMTDTLYADPLAKDLKTKNNSSPYYYSSNGNVMVLSGGFKSVSNYMDDIYNFLDS